MLKMLNSAAAIDCANKYREQSITIAMQWKGSLIFNIILSTDIYIDSLAL